MSESVIFVGNGWFPQMPGGLNRYVYELANHLALSSSPVDIELFGVGLPKSDVNSPYTLTSLASSDLALPLRLMSARSAFSRKRRFHQFDAINLHFSLYSLPLLDRIPPETPITFTFHGPWAYESKQENASKQSVFVKKLFEQYVYNRCDRFIVLSEAFGSILHDDYGVDKSRIFLIPGGVDTTRFQASLSRSQAREVLGWDRDRPILFSPRRLVHRMGLDRLIQAVASVKNSVPDLWLGIAGKGPLRGELEQQVQELKLDEHVNFLGFLPDDLLPIAYQAADLTVVPSQALEGFGLILLESLACGTPVLCTPVGGMPEILTPFCPELVTESTDVSDIANRLKAFLQGEMSLPSREACRNFATSNYDWHHISQKVREVLLLEKGSL